jgi:heme/copper-type cytochrome/quinol oxidase subunit 2
MALLESLILKLFIGFIGLLFLMSQLLFRVLKLSEYSKIENLNDLNNFIFLSILILILILILIFYFLVFR